MEIIMMNQPAQLQELLQLPAQERLRLARWLIDSTLEDETAGERPAANGLMSFAGRFSGGTGDSSERHEEILLAEVDKVRGFGEKQ